LCADSLSNKCIIVVLARTKSQIYINDSTSHWQILLLWLVIA